MEPNSAEDDARRSSKPDNSKNDQQSPQVASSGTNKSESKTSISADYNAYIDPKPGTSKSSQQTSFETSANSFNPEPSTSSKKTEMEKLLEERSSTSTPRGDKASGDNNADADNTTASLEDNFFSYYRGFNLGNSNFQYSEAPKKEYANSDEYFADLRQWLQQAYFWQSVTAAFPYFLMCQQFGQMSLQNSTAPSFPLPTNGVPPFPFPMPGVQYPRQDQQTVSRPEVIDGVECRIPSFWKRIAAEFIDFLILFFVKIAVTYVAVDFFHFVDMDTFDIFQKDVKLAYKTFIQITQDIVILEMIHRLVVCAFETFWLIGGYNGRIGGSTPGKNIMGLRVLLCESSSALREGDDRVIVRPGTNLGLGTAFFRALTKNFVLALLIPTSFAFIFFPHNRTGYDMICNTIVVEEPVIPHRVHQD